MSVALSRITNVGEAVWGDSPDVPVSRDVIPYQTDVARCWARSPCRHLNKPPVRWHRARLSLASLTVSGQPPTLLSFLLRTELKARLHRSSLAGTTKTVDEALVRQE